jgi:hypothetical protein
MPFQPEGSATTAMPGPPGHEASTSPPLPFSLSIDPRDRLLLFDVADDPVYAAIEIQVFDDEVHGQGMLVLLERRDGLVDFYRQPGLRLEREGFSIGRGVCEWRETRIAPDRFLIADDGVAVDVGFSDASDRRIEIRIDDRDGRRRTPSSLLAPVGSGVAHPTRFFAVVMLGFDLVRTSGIEPSLQIGGVDRQLVAFPGPSWLHRRRFVRYAREPVIAVLNPDHDGPLATMPEDGEVAELRAGAGRRTAALRFTPPFPDLRLLRVGDTESGAWRLDVADQRDLTGGGWTAARREAGADLAMTVTKPWQPRRLPLSLRIVTTVARVFRWWPTTYRWDAYVDLRCEPPGMVGRWSRTEEPARSGAYRLPHLGPALLVAGLGAALLAVAIGIAGWRRRRRGPP